MAVQDEMLPISPEALEKVVLDRGFASLPGEVTSPAALTAALRSDAERGLAAATVVSARAHFGENRLPPKALKSYLEHLKEALSDPILIALIICSVLTIFYGICEHHPPPPAIPPQPTRRPLTPTPSPSPPLPSPPATQLSPRRRPTTSRAAPSPWPSSS